MSLGLTVRAKGFKIFDRAAIIAARFGLGSKNMRNALGLYRSILAEADAPATFPITATVLRRHSGVLRELHDDRIEVAVHGLVHNDHAQMDLEEQQWAIRAAAAIFDRLEVPYRGFRGPYLRANEHTGQVLRELGFLYGCSQSVVFPVVGAAAVSRMGRHAYGRALGLYEPLDAKRIAVRPRQIEGVIDIPVALPDDEILVDRLGFTPAQQEAVWLAILDQTYERGELFTLQLHPERIRQAACALRTVLRRARTLDPKVWIARLDEIAYWWKRRSTFRLRVDEVHATRYVVQLDADDDARLLVRGDDRSPGTCLGQDQGSNHRLILDSRVKPVVGLSPRTSLALQPFLIEEGFPFEVSERPERFGAYLDLPSRTWDEADVLSAIARERGPIVQLARWPDGNRSALAVTGDIDSVTLSDFVWRALETW